MASDKVLEWFKSICIQLNGRITHKTLDGFTCELPEKTVLSFDLDKEGNLEVRWIKSLVPAKIHSFGRIKIEEPVAISAEYNVSWAVLQKDRGWIQTPVSAFKVRKDMKGRYRIYLETP